MSDAFWAFMGVLVVQVAGIVLVVLNNRKSTASRDEIKAQVLEVKDHLSTVSTVAQRSKEEVDFAHQAGERKGYVGGIKEGIKQASGPAPLGDDHGSDPNNKR